MRYVTRNGDSAAALTTGTLSRSSAAADHRKGVTLTAIDGLRAYVERRGDRSAEVVWDAALVMLERAAVEAREGKWGRWRNYPRGELRRLRRDVAEALELARLAVALQEEDRENELDVELRAQAAAAAARARREQTLPAERARLANAAARRKGTRP